MKKFFYILLFSVLAAAGCQGQTNATFNNLDVRNRTTLRGLHYIYDSTFFKPDMSNVPWFNPADTMRFLLTIQPADAKLVKVSLDMLTDSLFAFIDTSFWVRNGGDLYPKTITDSIGIGTILPTHPLHIWSLDTIPVLLYVDNPGSDVKIRFDDESGVVTESWQTGKGDAGFEIDNNTSTVFIIDEDGTIIATDAIFKSLPIRDSAAYVLATDADTVVKVTFPTLADSLGPYLDSYWTFVDAATDTLYNNTPPAGGIIALKNDVHTDRWLEHSSNTFFGRGMLDAGNLAHASGNQGYYNTGFGALVFGEITTGSFNTAVGYQACHNITYGASNVAFGRAALFNLTYGNYNTSVGTDALYTTTTDSYNTAIGNGSQYYNSGGESNTSVGVSSLYNNSTGDYNVAIGYEALKVNSSGAVANNVAIGCRAMQVAQAGASENVAIGHYALYSQGANDGTVAIGYNAMYYADNRTSATARITYNTAIGYEAMKGSVTPANNTGQYNTAVGYGALDEMTSGEKNTVLGVDAGGGITTGSSNIFIGYQAGSAETTASNKLYIENTNSATPLIWGDFALDSLKFNGDVVFDADVLYENTYWLDEKVSAMDLAPGANAPSLRTFKGGIKQYGYAGTGQNDSQYGQCQINHDMKLNPDSLEVHIHYSLETTPNAGDTAVFSFEYSWADIGEAFPTSDTLTKKVGLDGKAALTHYLVELGSMTTAGGDNVSSVVVFTITRLQDDPDDTGYDGVSDYVFLHDIDFHKEIDSPGSRQEVIK